MKHRVFGAKLAVIISVIFFSAGAFAMEHGDGDGPHGDRRPAARGGDFPRRANDLLAPRGTRARLPGPRHDGMLAPPSPPNYRRNDRRGYFTPIASGGLIWINATPDFAP